MKKKIITSTALIAIIGGVLATLNSCKKEAAQPQSPTNTFNVSVEQNPADGPKALSLSGTRLVFPTIADYRTAVDNPSLIAETALITTINAFANFTSLNEQFVNDTLFGKGIFPTLLNADGIVQIGEYIIKVNMLKKKVFVLPLRLVTQYSYLVSEDTIHATIKTFSTTDDVLEELEQGNFRGVFCREDKPGGREVHVASEKYAVKSDPNKRFLHAHAKYTAGGVYFSAKLWGDLYYVTGYDNQKYTGARVTDQVALRVVVKYKRRCDNIVGPQESTITAFAADAFYQSYQGSKALSAYYFQVQASANGVYTQNVGIRYGY
jgi:hypothetical protein